MRYTIERYLVLLKIRIFVNLGLEKLLSKKRVFTKKMISNNISIIVL